MYFYNPLHPHEKLGARGKKCIFIRYSKHSKGYVLISECDSGTITELESWDVIFLENECPSITDVLIFIYMK